MRRFALLFLLTACATSNINKLKFNMSEDRVVEIMGQPERAFRGKQGEIMYTYGGDGVIFVDEYLSKIIPLSSPPQAYNPDLSAAAESLQRAWTTPQSVLPASDDQRVYGNAIDENKSSLLKCESRSDCPMSEFCDKVNGPYAKGVCHK